MAVQRRRRREEPKGRGTAKLLRFAVIPVVVIVLIVIILCLDTPEDKGGEETSAPVVTDENGQPYGGDESGQGTDMTDMESAEPDEEEDHSSQAESEAPPADPSQYPFQQDAVLELTGLVQAYCEAKTECDPELLAWVFGIEDWSEEEKNERKTRMELVKASVKGYQNISCYSIQGPEQDSYVIFPYYEIRYRETETLMPAFSWGYARKDGSGRYYMVQDIDDGVNEYIGKVGEKAEVKAVMSQILARQQEAIASDEVLQKIYGSTGESEVIIGGVGG